MKMHLEKIESFFRKHGVPYAELAVYTRELAVLLNAGLSANKIMDVMFEQTANQKLKEVTASVRNYIVNNGLTLSQALYNHKDVFSSLYVAMVWCGEHTGTLPRTMNELAGNLERDINMINKYKAALTYPLIILVVSVFSALLILKFVLPSFVPIFDSFSLTLPWPTRILLFFNNLLNAWWFWILFLLVLPSLVIRLKYYFKTKKGKDVKDAIISYVPFFNKLAAKMVLVRFCRTFALLYAHGYPVLQSLKLMENVVDNTVFEREIKDIEAHISVGETLFEAVEREPHFSKIVSGMILAGEEAGKIAEVISKAAYYYEMETENFLESANNLFEPFTIVILGFTTGFIILALIMPLYQMLGSFGV